MAPHPFTKGENLIVFLSGPFDATPVTWQRAMTAALSYLDVTILNPQRLDWSSEWKEDPSFKPWVDQAKWELDGLEAADVIAIYFAPRMPQARILIELGLWARSSKCVVGCSEGYPQKADVRVICEKYGIDYVASVEELVATVRRKLDPRTRSPARANTGKAIQETQSMMNPIVSYIQHQ